MFCGGGLCCRKRAESYDDCGVDGAAVVEQYSDDLSDELLFSFGDGC